MLTGYLDESGQHDAATGRIVQFSVGCCIASFEAWQAFNEAWAVMLRARGLSSFHMTDFESYRGEFETVLKWDQNNPEHREAHNLLLNEALENITKHVRCAFGLTHFLEPEHKPDAEKKVLQDCYENNAVDAIWNAGRYAGALSDNIDLVFAHHRDFSIERIARHFGEFSEVDPRLNSVRACQRVATCPPLQVADIVAFETKCYHRELRGGEEHLRYPLRRLRELNVPIHFEWRSSRALSRKAHLKFPPIPPFDGDEEQSS
jgi:hypothetical protein